MGKKRKEWLQFGSGRSYFSSRASAVAVPGVYYAVAVVLSDWLGVSIRGMPKSRAASALGCRGVYFDADVFSRFLVRPGKVLPLFAVIAILLFWHLARKDPWDFEPKLYAGMAVESVVWGIPFFVMGLAIQRHIPAPGAGGMIAGLPWETEVVLSVGAGIYEELLFRLIAINVLSLILMDVLEMKPGLAMPVIIVASAILFSLYHYLGTEHFEFGTFSFRAAMGVFLAGIYVYRGFGIAVGRIRFMT